MISVAPLDAPDLPIGGAGRYERGWLSSAHRGKLREAWAQPRGRSRLRGQVNPWPVKVARSVGLKVALAAITVVLLLSQVGWLVVPLLLPAHMWAARRSGRAGRLIWSLLPASGLACAA